MLWTDAASPLASKLAIDAASTGNSTRLRPSTTVVAAGFVGFEITARVDVYAGAPQASSAAQFGTLGINFRARKPMAEDEWREAQAALSCTIG